MKKQLQAFFEETQKQLGLHYKKLLIYGVIGVIAFLILLPIGTYLYFARDLQSKEGIMNSNNIGVILLDRKDRPFFSLYEAKAQKFVPLSEIPKSLQDAVIATEDREFYQHPGFSLRGILRAIITDIQQEKLAFGGSTITQQLVKNAMLHPQKSFLRKYQELVLSAEIERRYSKEEILEMYLNSVYFGEGAIGVETAAEVYYGKSAKNLSLAESSMLVGILPAPSLYSPLTGDKEEAARLQKRVLQKMVEQKYITASQKQQAEAQRLFFSTVKETTINDTAPHFALYVKDLLIEKYGKDALSRSGFRVKTTLDLDWQKFAETTVKNHVATLTRNDASNGAAIAIDPKNGEIRAFVGSSDWYNEDFGKLNMAISPRQPGSSFKPIIYAKAFESEVITPGTVLDDKPTTFGGNYKPLNYDKKFRGPVLPRQALANSLNIPAVAIMEKVGVSDGLEIAQDLGITTLKDSTDYGLSLVLGTGEVPLIEMTSAFGVFANKGTYVKPTAILEIKDKRENREYTYIPESRSVLDEAVAFLISSILSDNTARQDVFGESLTINRPAAVKTGTTEDYRDALTIGYTPSLVVGVWVGNNDNTPMDSVAGSLGAAPIWRRLMTQFLMNTPVEQFTPPASVSRLMVCRENGLKATTATLSAYPEFFLRGTEPVKECTFAAEPSLTPTPATTTTPTPDQPTSVPTNQPTPTPTPTTVTLPTLLPTNTPSASTLTPSPTTP